MIAVLLFSSIAFASPPSEWTACKVDSDCQVVANDYCTCSSGGSSTSVRKDKFNDWLERLKQEQEKDGADCLAMVSNHWTCNDVRPTCKAGQCNLAKIPEPDYLKAEFQNCETVRDASFYPKCIQAVIKRKKDIRLCVKYKNIVNEPSCVWELAKSEKDIRKRMETCTRISSEAFYYCRDGLQGEVGSNAIYCLTPDLGCDGTLVSTDEKSCDVFRTIKLDKAYKECVQTAHAHAEAAKPKSAVDCVMSWCPDARPDGTCPRFPDSDFVKEGYAKCMRKVKDSKK